MPIRIAKTVRFPEVRIGAAGRPTTFGRNLDYLRRLKVGFSEDFALALRNPRHPLTRFFSEHDLETISRETGIAGIETGRWLTGLSQVFDGYCHDYDLTRTQRVPDGHREVAEFEIIHEEVTPPVRGRRFVLDYEEPPLVIKPELVSPFLSLPLTITAQELHEQLFRAQELFLDRRFAEIPPLIEAALDDMREGDLKPLVRLETLHLSAIMYIGMDKTAKGLELIEEMLPLFTQSGTDRFSFPRFLDFVMFALWKAGTRPPAYRAFNLSTDIAGEMIIILEMGDPGFSLMGKFLPVPKQLRTIRDYLKGETDEEAIRVLARVERLLERAEAIYEKYFSIKIGPKQKKLPN